MAFKGRMTVKIKWGSDLVGDMVDRKRNPGGGRHIGRVRDFFQIVISQRLTNFTVAPNRADLTFLRELLEDGTIASGGDGLAIDAELLFATLGDGQDHGVLGEQILGVGALGHLGHNSIFCLLP